ncbi:hypothetical protein RFI_40102, partial [Reticulomyxa filosa]
EIIKLEERKIALKKGDNVEKKGNYVCVSFFVCFLIFNKAIKVWIVFFQEKFKNCYDTFGFYHNKGMNNETIEFLNKP